MDRKRRGAYEQEKEESGQRRRKLRHEGKAGRSKGSNRAKRRMEERKEVG